MSGTWETPSLNLGQRVRITTDGRLGTVRGYVAWEPPIILYVVLDDDGKWEWSLSVSDLEKLVNADVARTVELGNVAGPS